MTVLAIPPSVEYKEAFLRFLADFETHDPAHAEFYLPAKEDFAAYVGGLLEEEQGINLREGWVPCTHQWLFTQDHQIAGVTRLRHRIDTPFLSANGGHIGYDIAPMHRRQGYGHLALQFSLRRASTLGLSRVLLFTAEDNAPSRAVIERAGGMLEQVAYSEFWSENLCKYWVPVPVGG
jgi:predicted acetyltransferase